LIKPQNITSNLLIRNSIYNVAAKVIFVGIGFVIIPLLILHLGKEAYGIWILIGSLFRYRDIFSLGLNSAVNRYIPHYAAVEDYSSISKVKSTAIVFYIFSSLLFLLMTIIFYYNITNWFSIPILYEDVSRYLVLIVGIAFSILIPLNINTAILSSFQRYDILNVGIIIHVVSRAIILIILLMNNYGLLAVGVVFTTTEIILKLFYNYFASRMTAEYGRISLKNIDFKLLKEMLTYGINTFLFSISIVVIYRSSDMIIGIFKSVTDVTNYSVITVLILVLHQLLQAFLSVIKPAISSLNAVSKSNQIRNIALRTQKYSLIFLIPSSIFFIIFGKELLSIWLGPDFSYLSSILTVLVIGNFFFLSQQSNYFVLVGKGEHKIFGLMAIITALCSVIFSIISLGIFKFDLVSVAVSTAIPMILISGVLLQGYFNNKMEINLIETLKNSWIPAIIGTIPSILLLLGIKYIFSPSNWTSLILIIGIVAVTTLLGALIFATNIDERNNLVKILKRGH